MKKELSNFSTVMSEEPPIKFSIKCQKASNANLKLKEFKRVEKWDSLYKGISKVSKSKNIKDLINNLPKIIENLIGFDKFSLILVDPIIEEHLNISDTGSPRRDGLTIGKAFINGRWLKLLSMIAYPCSRPQFSTFTQLAVGRKT